MPLRTFDASQPVEAYYKAKEGVRQRGLKDYEMQRQKKADERADTLFEQGQADRVGKLQDVEQKRRLEDDAELQAVGQREMMALNPDSETFDEDVMQGVDNYAAEMSARGYGGEEVRGHVQSIFQSGSLTPERVRAAQEKAGIRRKTENLTPPKERSRYYSADGNRMEQRQVWNKATGEYEDSGDPSLRDRPRGAGMTVYDSEGNPIVTTGDPSATMDKVRRRNLEGKRDSLEDASDYNKKLQGVLVDDAGELDYTILGAIGSGKQIAAGAQAQIKGFQDTVYADAINNKPEEGEDWTPSEWFDPKVGQATLLLNSLAYMRAKALDPSGRLSDFDVRQSVKALGGAGALANPADLMSRLKLDMEMSGKKLERIEKRLYGKDYKKNELPAGVTEEDIATTMKKNNMTRKEVLKRLNP